MKQELFNNNWLYWEDKNSFALVWSVPENAREVTLPHDAMIARPADPNSPNEGKTGYRNGENCVYVKHFTPAEADRDKTLTLRFDGVYQMAKVFVNEQLAATCPFGYTEFYVPLNGFLRYGQENEIRVTVRNSACTNSRWYSGTGIYRDVHLLTGGLTHVVPGGVRAVTESLDSGLAILRVEADVKNRCCGNADLKVVFRLVDGEGHEASSHTAVATLLEGEERTVFARLAVTDPKPWNEDTPNLYTLVTELWQGEELLDTDETVTGLRTLTLDAVRGLRVNGQTVDLRGACIHHDSGLLGAATYYDAEYRRVKLLKAAGFNAIRMSHHPAASALLRACDELGLYVMDEAFDMRHRAKSDNDYSLFFESSWQQDVEAMVRKDFNHPSVILYSVGNEIPEIGTVHGSRTCHNIASLIRKLDPTRFTTAGINGVFAAGDRMGEILGDIIAGLSPEEMPEGDVNDFMTLQRDHMDDIVRHRAIGERLDAATAPTDIAGYNYMTARYEEDALRYPNRIMVGSETNPPDISKNWALVKKLPQLIGDFTWTGWDYIGEAGLGIPAYAFGEGGFGAQYPCQLAYCGDMDITGFRRPQSYFREIVFGLRSDPYIAVQRPDRYGQPVMTTPWILSDADARWTWPGYEGKPAVVEVYAPGDRVELFLNGESLGDAPVEGHIARLETVYAPGTLEAVAYEGDKELGRHSIATADGGYALKWEAEPAGTNDGLIYLNLACTAANGVVDGGGEAELTITALDNAQQLGFGSGDPKPTHNYNEQITNTWQGRALLILRKPDACKPGVVTLSTPAGSITITI